MIMGGLCLWGDYDCGGIVFGVIVIVWRLFCGGIVFGAIVFGGL